MNRYARVLAVISFLLTLLVASSPISAYAASVASGTDVASASDAAYFDRIAVIPMDVEVPYFYQQVLNVAGMYIFSMPDGTVCKRIYGALNGAYGWYVPVGTGNTVPADSVPMNTEDDIAMYEAAVEEYNLKTSGEQQFTGILPPESGTYDLSTVFGYSAREFFRYLVFGAAGMCLLILLGFAMKKAAKRNKNR